MGITLIILGIVVVIIAILVWYIYIDTKNDEKMKTYTEYFFAYSIKEDASKLPTEFLANWKVSALENHLYLLDITLEDDLYLLGYLQNIWRFYDDYRVYIKAYEKVYSRYEIHHEPLGEFMVEGGKVYKIK